MRYLRRSLETQILKAAANFPAIVLTGPRRAGKTLLLRRLFPKASYFLLEDPDVIARVRGDPQAFLDAAHAPVILDEVQNTPEMFSYVRSRIDASPRKTGRWFLTGSQEAPLMRNVAESMAGRAAILQLLPLSAKESAKVSPLRGGYPEALARPGAASLWFSSYIQTYLERDVRAVTNVRDLPTFRRFLGLVASRHGQTLNRTDLAAPLGVSVPTITEWLNVLETTAQIILVPPFYENVGKRLIKSPKIYIADSGLACHLLGIDTAKDLARSPFQGAIFEGFIAAEILKSQFAAGRRRELYFFRDEQGLEVDFLIPGKNGTISLIECKAGRTITPKLADPLRRLHDAFEKAGRMATRMLIVHQPASHPMPSQAVAPGVRALDWRTFVDEL